MTYDEYILSKVKTAQNHGFEPVKEINPMLFGWQKAVVKWALRTGRAALFEDCGLGKTAQQLDISEKICDHTQGDALILTPLAVAQQTVSEGEKFGIKVNHAFNQDTVKRGINITNYERLSHFDPEKFSCVVLDESSILKGFNGKMRRELTDAFKNTPYRFCCTATPAPNDFTELGQHAEFLGVCSPAQMLATYFINDTFDTGTWRLKGHAVESFWRWVSTWAACVSKPSDIGGSDDGFELPPVHTEIVTVRVDQRADAETGELFVSPNVSATAFHAEQRRTMKERVAAAAKIVNESTGPFVVWCESNDESAELLLSIPDAVEVKGCDKPEHKERKLTMFSTSEARVIITKPSIAGFGMNWQHCNQEIYVGMNYSFERFYQASKRIHRFGQKRDVYRYIIQADTENGVMASIQRKANQHAQMQELMQFTRENLINQTSFVSMNTEIKKAEGDNWEIYNGDCVRVAKTLEDNSIGFSVFSPPFADLFTYSSDIQDMGNCDGLKSFMEQFGFLIDELGRITMPGRECAVHCCDLLATKWKDGEIEFKDFSSAIADAFRSRGWLFHSRITIWKNPVTEMQRTKAHGLLYKTLKSDSSKSRVGAAEYLLVFRKRGDNPKPITHTPNEFPLDLWQEIASPVWMTINQGRVLNKEVAREDKDEKHICPLQLDVIDRALLLWSTNNDVVFSPFAGIGSEGYCAVRMGRKFIGVELKESYWKTATNNLKRANSESLCLF